MTMAVAHSGRRGHDLKKTHEKLSLSDPPLVYDKDDERKKSQDHLSLQLDTGVVKIRKRDGWWKIWIPRGDPPPTPSSFLDAPEIPLASASIFSLLSFSWVGPIMTLGYQRTLQATDLWKLDHLHTSGFLAGKFGESWTRRQKDADNWNEGLENGLHNPGTFLRFTWFLRSISAGPKYSVRRSTLEKNWREHGGKKNPSIFLALNDTIGFFWWSGGMFKVFGDVSQLMCPLVIKAIINFAKAREIAIAKGEPGPHLAMGFALALALFFLSICTSIGQHQFFWRSMISGCLARAVLIKSVYNQGVNLTGRARTRISNSDIVNHVSTDISRVDYCAQWFHAVWTAPIQITICLIVLVIQLGPAALTGFLFFVIVGPVQERAMEQQHRIRKASAVYTEQRANTLLEILGSMRVVKYFSYEAPFLNRIYDIRRHELRSVMNILISQSGNIALAFSVPVLATTVAFITYTHVTHAFDVAVIFSSLSLFQLLRQPTMFLPRALSATADARSALSRISRLFNAEVRPPQAFDHVEDLNMGVHVENATFEWEEVYLNDSDGTLNSPQSRRPFRIQGVNMQVKRGSLAAIVGRVGAGKSSLLMGLVGEMRKVSGTVRFGGRLAYCSQRAWVQNASVRDNILFGQPFDKEKYWKVVEQTSLLPDLEILPDGDLTEIGERGVNLSGGQKQRINMARALYYDAAVIVLDDPLSAVDAHVGNALFHDAILYLRNQGKTVVFVTHALHFLSFCDYIYILRDGRIAEQGVYKELINSFGDFVEPEGPEDIEDGVDNFARANESGKDTQAKPAIGIRGAAGTGKLEGKLIVKEARSTGSIPGEVWKSYFLAGRGWFLIPAMFFCLFITQASQILSSYTLVWWQENSFNRPFSFYQILYAGLGVAQSFFTFLIGVSTDVFSYFASQNLHHEAIHKIFYAPMSFFDTTPTGRIVGVFGKDIDNIDNQLPISLRLLVITVAMALGAVIITTILEYYFIIVVVVIFFGYQYFAAFYRASAREVKRLDAMLRSLLYSHLSESLTGLPIIRTYGELPRFIRENEFYIDLENRGLFVSITNQRWLGIRLDFCGACLVFSVALFAVFNVSRMSAAQIGLVLTYTTSLTISFGLVIRQTAEFENYLNSVERVAQYSCIAQEAPHEIPENKPPPHWPQRGAIEFRNVFLRYRPKLPNVLHDISMSIQGSEKIGVVGRTGAGKSSITLALLRVVEFEGSISIDGVDISKIGLKDLRTRIAIIPQDPTVFRGTVRTALDPFSLYDDAHLWEALRRSFLVDRAEENHGRTEDQPTSSKITLDTVLDSEGSNLSVGQRSLLSLARALVRDTRVVIMDEATASVDLETDKKIQYTIQTEFKDRTLICIAHRLRTILTYDRILVLDNGNIVEFDSPSALYKIQNGVFRGLCEKSNIAEQEFD